MAGSCSFGNWRAPNAVIQIQKAIQDLHTAFARSSFTVIENNSIGAAVADNLSIPEHRLRRFTTSQASKERIIEALRLRLQLQVIKFQPSLKQLASELRDYQLPDTNVVQDSVMALAIALEHAPEAQAFKSSGRVDRRLFRALNPPVSSRQPFSTGIITWTPAN